jgi:hypothetical protein
LLFGASGWLTRPLLLLCTSRFCKCNC